MQMLENVLFIIERWYMKIQSPISLCCWSLQGYFQSSNGVTGPPRSADPAAVSGRLCWDWKADEDDEHWAEAPYIERKLGWDMCSSIMMGWSEHAALFKEHLPLKMTPWNYAYLYTTDSMWHGVRITPTIWHTEGKENLVGLSQHQHKHANSAGSWFNHFSPPAL